MIVGAKLVTCIKNWPNPLTLKLENPPSIHPPPGLYSHTVTVPEGTELIFISGQVGIRPDGSTPTTISEQADQVFSNIAAVLDFHGLATTDIVKLVTFIVDGHDGNVVMSARLEFLDTHRPASSTVYVPALVSPLWHVEVEAIAAKTRVSG